MEKIKAGVSTNSKKKAPLNSPPLKQPTVPEPKSFQKIFTRYQPVKDQNAITKLSVAGEEPEIKVDFRKLFKKFIESVDLFAAQDQTNNVIEDLRNIAAERAKLSERIAQSKNKDERTSEKDKLKEILTDESNKLRILRENVEVASTRLPGIYRKDYAGPVIADMRTLQNISPGTLETLTGAIYDHASPEVEMYTRRFLALTSNVYRSFLQPEVLPLADFPQPVSTLPGLATFRPKLDLNILNPQFAPFTLPSDEVERLCGSKVSVISLPSCYRDHPVLSWVCVAHEAGGHDVLHSYPGLLQELRQGVRELFYQGRDPQNGEFESQRQFLGLLWQHWTEEAAADVYAVMNIGPCYGIAMTTYLAALSERIRTEYFYSFGGNGGKRDGIPALAVSSRMDETFVDYHPTKVLSLYVIIGAIDALTSLSEDVKNQYINAIQGCIDECLEENNVLTNMGRVMPSLDRFVGHYSADVVKIRGFMRIKSGYWIQIPDNDYCSLPLNEMANYAHDVGYYIATAKLRALNGHSIQDLETWDTSDETAAGAIRDYFINRNKHKGDILSDLGDDAQLFAGAIRALGECPDQYDLINKDVGEALDISFMNDEVWGTPAWHPIADGWKRKAPPNRS